MCPPIPNHGINYYALALGLPVALRAQRLAELERMIHGPGAPETKIMLVALQSALLSVMLDERSPDPEHRPEHRLGGPNLNRLGA